MKPTALIIMDGFGLSKNTEGNAVLAAGTPRLDALLARFPHTEISASGMDVGLPPGQMGNSEVGHLNLGAGRVVYQKLTLITKDILEGGFYKKPVLLAAMENAKKDRLHLMGLLSDGGVHSHIDHLLALLRLAKEQGVAEPIVHCFLDGRDVPPSSAGEYIAQLEAHLKETGYGKIGTVMGRYYAMDRDNRWDRVEQAYNALTAGEGAVFKSAGEAVAASYANGVTDEFMKPAVIAETPSIKQNDTVIFYNFRPDRAREITRALTEAEFSCCARKTYISPLHFVCLAEYDSTFTHVRVAYTQQELNISLKNTLGEYLSRQGKTQLRIAETEKYAHVTFFFNGGVEEPNPGEDRVLVPSPKVATYDLQPPMSAPEVASKAIQLIRQEKYDMIVLNFANCDMVGHTGVYPAAVEAVKTVDTCVGDVVEALLSVGGKAIITADHGNAEQMLYYGTKVPFTAHTTNPVPFVLVDPSRPNARLLQGGKLANVAPTLLELMGLPIPAEMDAGSMLV